MHVLISHQSSVATARLRGHLSKDPAVTRCHSVSALTETYDYAEHQAPDCVILSAALADCAEFELLNSLLRIMEIGCVLVGQAKMHGPVSIAAANTHVFRLPEDPSGAEIAAALRAMVRRPAQRPARPMATHVDKSFDPRRIILIGASTGGIDALLKITRHFSEHCPPTLIVQHTGGGFAQSLIRLLDGATQATVKEAQDNAVLQPGHIYLAPDDRHHLCLSPRRDAHIALRSTDLVSGHRPSIDALFSSAKASADNVAAALLTGMGRDGARGLTELRQAGAYTIGQDEATSVVYGMPRIAKEFGGVCDQLPVDQIGPALLRASGVVARQ